MSNEKITPEIAKAILALAPPLMRRTLLEDIDIQKEYHFASEAILTFQNPSVSFNRALLFNAVRECFTSAAEEEVVDEEGNSWRLSFEESIEDEPPNFILSCEADEFMLPDMSLLSPEKVKRIRVLVKACNKVNLPSEARDNWRIVFTDNSFADRSIDDFWQDIRETPAYFTNSIRQMLNSGEIDVSHLVPLSRKYFNRIIGTYDGSTSIIEYASGSCKEFLKQLSTLEPYSGLLVSLLLSAHSAISAEIQTVHIGNEVILKAFGYLEKHGDLISKVGAVEIGLRIFSETPEIDSVLVQLIKQIRDDDAEGIDGQFKLLSSLFILVDGILSETKLFSTEPPFYRRLASFSQASLIHRQILNSGIEIGSFCEFVLRKYSQQYYMQTLVDMRSEPRWDPDYGTPSQLKAEFYGRIINAATQVEKDLTSELRSLTLGEENDSIKSLCEFPFHLYPGPLEGFEKSPNALPDQTSELIDEQLLSGKVEPLSFAMLVNLAPVFHLHPDKAELAAKAIKLGNDRLSDVQNKSNLLFVLNGLASVAAITRSKILADELTVLVRRYRYEAQYKLTMIEAIKICHLVSASRGTFSEWQTSLGESLTELAFGNLEGDEGDILYAHIQGICNIVPELWVSCGRAEAALSAYNAVRKFVKG